MLHLGREPRGFDAAVVERVVVALSSTSPSGILVGSLDAARAWIATDGERAIGQTVEAVRFAHQAIRSLGLGVLDHTAIGAYGIADIDLLRLCIDCRPAHVDGRDVAAALRAANVHPELAGANVVVATLAPGEGYEQIQVLVHALARSLKRCPRVAAGAAVRALPPPGPMAMTPREAWLSPSERVPLDDAAGRISADTLSVYPPGIPNFVPGEMITSDVAGYVRESLAAGAHVRGVWDAEAAAVSVVRE
jgi:lysine decarboxylase